LAMIMLDELLSFMRLRIAVGVALLSLFGCLLYGLPLDPTLIAVAATFFTFASIYSLNNITDVEEDRVNRKRINHFSARRSGLVITAMLAALGLSAASLLHPYSFLAYLALAAASVVYSVLRVKKILIVKNVYTSLFIALAFVAGSLPLFDGRMLLDVVFIFVYTAIGTVLADTRDIEGDKANGVLTVPVVFGYDAAVSLIYAGTLAQMGFLFLFNLSHFFITIPFSLLMMYLLSKRNFERAHVTGTIALILMIAYAIYAKTVI